MCAGLLIALMCRIEPFNTFLVKRSYCPSSGLQERYREESFVHVLPAGQVPQVTGAAGWVHAFNHSMSA